MPAWRTGVHTPELLTPGVPVPEPEHGSGWVKTRPAPNKTEPAKTSVKKTEEPPAKGSSNSKKRP